MLFILVGLLYQHINKIEFVRINAENGSRTSAELHR